MDAEESLYRSYHNYQSKSCPLQILGTDGVKTDVWDLKDKNIYEFIDSIAKKSKGSNEISSEIKGDVINFQRISKCWMQNNQPSNKLILNLFRNINGMDQSSRKELMRDICAPIMNDKIYKIKDAYQLIHGVVPTNDQIIDTLQNMVARDMEKEQGREMN